MAITIASGSAVALTASTKTADQVSGTYQYTGRGKYTLVAKSSATAVNVTCLINGIPLINDLPIPFTGTAGTIDVSANIVASQVMNGGRAEVFFRETAAGAGKTVDFILLFEAM